MFENCLLSFSGFFSMWRRRQYTLDEVIGYCEYEELKRRFDHGLSPKATTFSSTMLDSAIHRFSNNNFDQMCPILCLLFEKGVDLNQKGIHSAFLIPQQYNQHIVELSIVYGADYREHKGIVEGSCTARALMESDYAILARLHQEGNSLYENGNYREAHVKYEQAIKLANKFYDTAQYQLANQAINTLFKEKMHQSIVDSYIHLALTLKSKKDRCNELLHVSTVSLTKFKKT